MPILPAQSLKLDRDTVRVLITGFGPFSVFKEVNPSWLAVRPLHNTILHTESPAVPVTHKNTIVEDPPASPRQIHITTLEVPVTYDAVLTQIPGLHQSPPVFPTHTDPSFSIPPPPYKGYDFIMHVGVAGPGPLALEKLAHKSGYLSKDVDDKLAPEMNAQEGEKADRELSAAELFEGERAGGISFTSSAIQRGFAEGYETFDEELFTQIDTDELCTYLRSVGASPVHVSEDPGRYLCDFIYYCSLAEAQRQSKITGKDTTPVLFLHCPPVGQPLDTEAVTNAIKRIVSWVSARI
ncbi:hypothetical protein BXZ70DRAFT_891500 [Cristinia sonorae]|uniref:Peptidase C15, pyroglutamyl peptidase I-like protein n=1 Tax=Cristinia sonorae TaxID=1940300 RepID=A0A8K0UPG1_9AGAR|nr:hypothetical protein BXZ70DRAFT_891500 [Cristinia sonorae]